MKRLRNALFFLSVFMVGTACLMAIVKFFKTSVANASGVVVTGANQPSATLAPQKAVVEFTNFTIRTSGQEVHLSEVLVEISGLGSPDAVNEVMLIAKKSPGLSSWSEDRVIAIGVFDSNGIVRLKNSPNNGGLTSFNNATRFTVAVLMKNDLSQYAGQVMNLSVKKLKITNLDGKRLKVKGKLPITGAGHTINSSMDIGSLVINSEYKIGHPYAQFNITAGSAESMVISKIFLRLTDDSFNENSGLFFVVSGQKYQFSRNGQWLSLHFKESLEISVGESVSAEIQTDTKYGLPEVIVRQEDVIISGKTYGYKVIPELNMEISTD